MVQRAQIVIGPAGTGKSTYCNTIYEYCVSQKRTVRLINLDPAADNLPYKCDLDIRDLITLDDVVEELNYGPNGGLVYCMEYLVENIEWLHDAFSEFGEDEYFLIDCPGQIEFFTHFPMLKIIIKHMQDWNIRMCCVYLMDSLFVTDPTKYISGALMGMSSMIQLELPHLNILSKCDLMKKEQYEEYLVPDGLTLCDKLNKKMDRRYQSLNVQLCDLLDSYDLVSFLPMNINDEDSVGNILLQCDFCTQFEEDQEPVIREDEYGGDEKEENESNEYDGCCGEDSFHNYN